MARLDGNGDAHDPRGHYTAKSNERPSGALVRRYGPAEIQRALEGMQLARADRVDAQRIEQLARARYIAIAIRARHPDAANIRLVPGDGEAAWAAQQITTLGGDTIRLEPDEEFVPPLDECANLPASKPVILSDIESIADPAYAWFNTGRTEFGARYGEIDLELALR